jgi:RNA recognition motif-containing protein
MPGPASSVRMYLGNLPPDISEKNIRERLKAFGRAADVDIKHRKDHEGRVTATFAHFSLALVNQGDIEKCKLNFINFVCIICHSHKIKTTIEQLNIFYLFTF